MGEVFTVDARVSTQAVKQISFRGLARQLFINRGLTEEAHGIKPKGWVGLGASTKQYAKHKQRAMLEWATRHFSEVLVVIAEATEQSNIRHLDDAAAERRIRNLALVRGWAEELAAQSTQGRIIVTDDREIVKQTAELRRLIAEATLIKCPVQPSPPAAIMQQRGNADASDQRRDNFSWIATVRWPTEYFVLGSVASSKNPLLEDLKECSLNYGARHSLHTTDTDLSLIQYALNEVAMILHVFIKMGYPIKLGPTYENRYDSIVYKILAGEYPGPLLEMLARIPGIDKVSVHDFGSVYFELA